MRKVVFFTTVALLLTVTCWFHFYSWTAIEGPPIPAGGYVALAIGTVYAAVVATALVALIFAIRSRD
jgi:hypothetical protein